MTTPGVAGLALLSRSSRYIGARRTELSLPMLCFDSPSATLRIEVDVTKGFKTESNPFGEKRRRSTIAPESAG